jgi:multidrug resistance efflux pump
VVGLAVLAAAGYAVWLWMASAARVSTDDAHVEGPVVVVSARVPGPVARVLVRDN